MQRREFLATALLSAAATRLAKAASTKLPTPAIERAGRPQQVLVIGAGLAGLVAAHELRKAGHQVTVLEATHIPGGRVRSWRGFADGLHGEAGAARIPPEHDLSLGYAAAFGLETRLFYPAAGDLLEVFAEGRQTYPIHGAPDLARCPLPLSATEREMGLSMIGERSMAPLMDKLGDLTADDWPPAELAPFDRYSVDEWNAEQGLSRAAGRALAVGFSDPEGDWYGLLWLLREIMLGPTSGAGLLRLADGNDRLPQAFAKELAGEIRYGHEVTAIAQDERGVEVRVRGLSDPIRAERAILTLPFPVMRRVPLQTPLSRGKRRAIEEMGYYSLSRVALQVRGRAWLPAGMSGIVRTELPSEIWLFTHANSGPRDIVQVYVKGNASQQMGAMGADERVRFAIAHVESVFPGFAPHVEGGESVCWDEEPFARGAHAALLPGQMTALMPHVASIEGRLHFAGEHTSPWHGWMQGALFSGRRAAREVAEASV
jgi:monoamine oxidase